jgi:hypothetical protein
MHRWSAVVTRLISGCGAAILALQVIACGSTSVTQSTGPESARCQASLNTIPTIPAAGGRVDVAVVTQRECGWSASSNSSWIQLSPTAGQGEASITLTAAANPQGIARNGNIAVNGSQVAVTQAAAPCTYSLDPADVTIPAAGGSTGTHVETLAGCSWTTSSPVSWAQPGTRAATGPGDVTVAIAPNSATTARSVDVVIAGRNFTISQAGAAQTNPTNPGNPTNPTNPTNPSDPTTPTNPTQPCLYLLDPLTQVVRARGGDQTVKVITGADCSWSAAADVDWLKLKGSTDGRGTREFKYEVDRNRTGRPRMGTITVAGLSHIVIQESDED